MSDPRTLAIPCRADGCPSLVGLIERGDGAWRGECSGCGCVWSLVPGLPAAVLRPASGFGAAIRREREAAGLSQVRLAAALAVDSTHVSRLESGDRAPSWGTLARLCDVLPGLAAALAGEAERTEAMSA